MSIGSYNVLLYPYILASSFCILIFFIYFLAGLVDKSYLVILIIVPEGALIASGVAIWLFLLIYLYSYDVSMIFFPGYGFAWN